MDASASPAAPDPAPVPGTPGPPHPRPAAAGPEPVSAPATAPVSRLRRLAAPAGAMAVVVGAFGYVATVDPNEPGHYPVCPMLRFTGVFCPGCGGLRSAHAFAHGDIAAALGSNALAVVGYAVFAVVWLLWMVRASRGEPLRIALAPAYWWGVGAALLIFSVVRNLPFGSGLAP
ncbi:DUF2752 domain-containing protein [Streptomyces sp. NPDC056452]|uniref:DUF2752 domain-containing protein n=1 Tax=Streptomyces sp. NPDC056452 TaxID=3345821 RepID=UPI0036B82A5C